MELLNWWGTSKPGGSTGCQPNPTQLAWKATVPDGPDVHAVVLAAHRLMGGGWAGKGMDNTGKPLGTSQLEPYQADSLPQTVEGAVQT